VVAKVEVTAVLVSNDLVGVVVNEQEDIRHRIHHRHLEAGAVADPVAVVITIRVVLWQENGKYHVIHE
jgi:hypothetical protein